MRTFADSKINVTTLSHLKKLDCCNFFFFLRVFLFCSERSSTHVHMTVTSISQSIYKITCFAGKVTGGSCDFLNMPMVELWLEGRRPEQCSNS